MRQSADIPSRELLLARPADGTFRCELLVRLAARFEASGAGGLGWDALCDAKREAWPTSEHAAEQAGRVG